MTQTMRIIRSVALSVAVSNLLINIIENWKKYLKSNPEIQVYLLIMGR